MKRRRGGLSPTKQSPPGKVWAFLGVTPMPDGSFIKRWGWMDAERMHNNCKQRMDEFDALPPYRREQERGS